MQNNPGRTARPKSATMPAPCPEFTEEQLIAFDRAYAAAKDTGALDRMQVAAAVNIELSQNRAGCFA